MKLNSVSEFFYTILCPNCSGYMVLWHWGEHCYQKGENLPKSSFDFLTKRCIFYMAQEFYWTTYSPFCSTIFCHIPGNVIIPFSKNFLSSWAKNCSRYLLQSSRELIFFPVRESCKDQNKWKFKGTMFCEYGGWIRNSQTSPNSFFLVITHQRIMQSWVILMEEWVFCRLIPGAFHQGLSSDGLIGRSTCWN